MLARGRVSNGTAVIERATTEAEQQGWKLPELRLWLVPFRVYLLGARTLVTELSQMFKRFANKNIRPNIDSSPLKLISLNIWTRPW
mgnify:CR=1 FL=1